MARIFAPDGTRTIVGLAIRLNRQGEGTIIGDAGWLRVLEDGLLSDCCCTAGSDPSDQLRGAVALPPKQARAYGASRLSLLVPGRRERRCRRRARIQAEATAVWRARAASCRRPERASAGAHGDARTCEVAGAESRRGSLCCSVAGSSSQGMGSNDRETLAHPKVQERGVFVWSVGGARHPGGWGNLGGLSRGSDTRTARWAALGEEPGRAG
jgi:hypothetical protein